MSGFNEITTEEAAEGLRRLIGRMGVFEALEYLTAGSIIIGTGLALKTETKTAAYVFTPTDFNINGNATAASFSVTLPTAASAYNATTKIGDVFSLRKVNSNVNTVTLQANGAETINGSNTQVLIFQYDEITVQSNGVSWDIIL